MNEKLQQSIDDPEFSRLLEESQSYFDEAQSFYNWEPHDGQTVCQLVQVIHDKTTNKKLNKEVARVRAIVEIQDGENAGKQFDLAGAWGWTTNLTGLKTLASLLADEPIDKVVDAIAVLYDNIGAGILVSTSTTKNEKGTFVNHRPLERVPIETAN